MGIGISTFTEIVAAGPSKHFDILGIKMFDSAEIRVHPTGKAMVRLGVKSQGQGHETTFAQIVAEELGLPVGDIAVEEGDTDTAPYGLGTYASRSTPVAARKRAGSAEDPRRGEVSRQISSKRTPRHHGKDYKSRSMASDEVEDMRRSRRAYTNHPQGMEGGSRPSILRSRTSHTIRSYICVSTSTGQRRGEDPRFVGWTMREQHNPVIVEGRSTGGLKCLATAL